MKKGSKIVVIGGGFAGLNICQELVNTGVDVLLIDKQNHHQFQPLFYQVATASLEPSNISFPFRKVFQKADNVDFLMSEVIKIHPERLIVETECGKVDYDYLIIATGCTTNFFGNEDLKKYTLPMKTTQEAIEIRNRILMSFEQLVIANEFEKEALLNLVIVGGGATGVELSGAFAEMKMKVLPKDYPHIDFSSMRVILIEGSANTLNSMSDEAKKASKRYLLELGVEVLLKTNVTNYDGSIVTLNNGQQIKSKNVIWAAGVKGNILEGFNEEAIFQNRYITDRFNKIKGFENIYAIGDVAYMETPKYPKGHPQVANVAINQGKNFAKNILRSLNNKKSIPFEYVDRGSMATVGKHKAVVDLPKWKFQGYLAWFLWMFLHLMLILSLHNKLAVFFNWMWNYFSRDSSLRLIFNIPKKRNKC